MVSRFAVAAITVACLLVAPAGAAARPHGNFTPGAPGIGDPYFPLDGNGGYDVGHYLLDFRYDPAVGVLDARETIRARATQNLSSFNLDFHTLDIDTIYVDGRSATWSRDGDELTVTPRRPLHKGERFTTVLFYDGVPDSLPDGPGWLQTDDGVLVAGEPHGPSTYFAVNDHPLDKASYTFRITVPSGVEAVANGLLRSRRTHRGWTTWVWDAQEPMASYLATVDIGQFDLRFSRAGRVRIIDAVDPDLYNRVQPRTGSQFALSQSANLSYKRLTHVINAPAAGANMSFWVTRDTELNWDFFFVEAHTVGADDWTTLPDVNGHTGTDTGFVCPLSLELHPFLAHYETDNGDGTCSATGTTGGTWNAVSGQSDGYEQWKVDLSAYAGKQVEVSTTSSTSAASSSTTSRSPPGRARRRSRTMETRSTAGRSPERHPIARRTTTTGSSAPRPTSRRRRARSPTLRSPSSRRSSHSSKGCTGATRGRAPARSSTTCRVSGSLSRPKAGRCTPSTSSPTGPKPRRPTQ
jgi:hypothetical protein